MGREVIATAIIDTHSISTCIEYGVLGGKHWWCLGETDEYIDPCS